MKVLKFGGTSVANAENIKSAIDIIIDKQKSDKNIVVIVSALGGVTNRLIETADLAAAKNDDYQEAFKELKSQHNKAINRLIKTADTSSAKDGVESIYQELKDALGGIYLLGELSPQSLDLVLSSGERLSSLIISGSINARGIRCEHVDSPSVIKTDDTFGRAEVDLAKTSQLLEDKFKSHPGLVLMGGFIASSDKGLATTLGRGGSDYTASIVGAALNAESIEIWTDVDGVLTADPRKIEEAFALENISYEEAGELAHFGAKVVHPKTMRPAKLKNIPIYIKNTFNPDADGTRISSGEDAGKYPIKGISTLADVVLLRIHSNNGKSIGEIGSKVFDILSRKNIDILLTTQASYEQALSVAVPKHLSHQARRALEKSLHLEIKAAHLSPVVVEENLSVVAIVGKQMRGVPGISGKLFSTLGDNGVNVAAIAQGSSELNISTVIQTKDEKTALNAIHSAFFGRRNKTINIFMVGAGLIGSTLLKQVEESDAPLRLCGIANSKKMLTDGRGISLNSWKDRLAKAGASNLEQYVKEMSSLELPNTVFVDCTASEAAPAVYDEVLKSGIAIVTPNKKANSGQYYRYQELLNLAGKHGTSFRYETNVGAGLPVINTLKSLVATGDEIMQIEAVLSGTLSYIFNTFSSSKSKFSEVVKVAKAKGYTEPDPRDDLNGLDVARKILILAREAGIGLELHQVRINPLLDDKYFEADSVDEFMKNLSKTDKLYEERKQKAKKQGKVLRHSATLKDGKAEIRLVEVGPDHPFYNLIGSDNIVSITSRRYPETPLVVKGPGAGAEVTAGGVLADILSI